MTLDAVACPAASWCVAVGGSSLGTLAEEWNGTFWSVQATPSPADAAVLNAVSCVSVTACVAVGSTGSGLLAEAWNGTGWTVQPVSPGSGAAFSSVWCGSVSQCVAVGANGAGPIAEGWNGSRWARQPGLPPKHHPPSMRLAALYGVWCASARSCVAAGNAFRIPGPPEIAVTTWNGTKWSWSGGASALGVLNGISCSAQVCMAAGQNAAPFPRAHVPSPLVLKHVRRLNGTVVLTPVPRGFGTGALAAVSCWATVCEAVGGTDLGTLADRWTGTRWSLQSTPDPAAGTGELNGVACTSATACVAVGDGGNEPLAEAYSG